jgi:hypothetical protein
MKSTPILHCAVYAAVLSVSGCTTSIVGSSSTSKSGVAYMLPKSLLPVEVFDTGDGFTFTVKDPVLKGDPSKRFVLTRAGNAFSSDNVDIDVAPSTGLLESVKVDSTDETLNIASKIMSTIVAESAKADSGSDSASLVFRGLLDPEGDTGEFNNKLNAAISKHLAVKQRFACKGGPDSDACNTAKDLADLHGFGPFEVAVAKPEDNPVVAEVSPMGGEAVGGEADCKKGVCYRVNQPYLVTLSGPNGSSQQAYVGLPNGSPTYVMPVDRWPFVKNTHDIKLENGVLKSIDTDKPSSALAAISWPISAAKSAFEAVGEIIQLKIDTSGKYAALAKQEVATAKAEADRDKALISGGALNPESSLYGGNKSSGGLISVHVGLRAPKSGGAMDGLKDNSQDNGNGGQRGDGRNRSSNNGTVDP